jgi:hypothetical protein
MNRAFGQIHAALTHTGARLRSSLGQGTVEYVALILLVALILAGAIAALRGFKTDDGKELADAVIQKIIDAVNKVQF